MRDRVITVVSNVIGVPVESLDAHSSQNTVEYWDSLKHMSLVLALEEEFDVLFSDGEVAKLDSIGSILTVVESKIDKGSR